LDIFGFSLTVMCYVTTLKNMNRVVTNDTKTLICFTVKTPNLTFSFEGLFQNSKAYIFSKIQQDSQYTYQRNIEARSSRHRCRGKAIIITYSKYVFVGVVIQQAKRMRRIVLPSVVCLALLNFSTLSHNRTIFGKKFIEHKMRVSIFPTAFVRNISHSKRI
jgi:hypothetical protein